MGWARDRIILRHQISTPGISSTSIPNSSNFKISIRPYTSIAITNIPSIHISNRINIPGTYTYEIITLNSSTSNKSTSNICTLKLRYLDICIPSINTLDISILSINTSNTNALSTNISNISISDTKTLNSSITSTV